MMEKHQGSPVQEVNDLELKDSGIRLLIKREDLIHEHISGNKWRKLKYNLREAAEQNHHTLLTFGGAYSNHIAATSFAAQKLGLSSIGIIRGEDDPTNPTLKFAREQGMMLRFVSRKDYREMTFVETRLIASNSRVSQDQQARSIASLQEEFGRFFLVPEGGANGLGVRGCAEILPEVEEDFDVVCCPAGTGTTLAGLALTLKEDQNLLGFPALKGGEFLQEEVERLMEESRLRPQSTVNFQLITDYHFGGYAKMTPELLAFINGFQKRTGIPLDPIYTGKMIFGIYDMIQKGRFKKGTTILAIHTGGLQGWQGMKHRALI
ncbi:MAG: 1-aminocyclopropane-1-carboxylate deaminase/D-cysteine desulfhydrase [Flavobacteriales bacterium]|nr:1-aminocyclopropane-1-carboxylate deaminase/D-cysteine desulfhydrase [Flavobacteriales bacterium]